MTKVMCACIECIHNSSNIVDTLGECTKKELKIENKEYVDGETGNYEDFPKCCDFDWAYKQINYHPEVK